MIAAISTMPEKFSRLELFDAIRKDGKGEIKESSLSVYFPRFIDEGYIIEREEPRGHQPGLYAKGYKSV